QEQADVVRQHQAAALLMPPSPIRRDHGVSAGHDAAADLGQCRFMASALA
ncbi:MAG: hypothetical protein JWQ55_5841, partial [Rhodopila sp.]|nr:hypothetical protein [Rhodopila sp.]